MTDSRPDPTNPWAPESGSLQPSGSPEIPEHELDGAVLRSPATPDDNGVRWPWEPDHEGNLESGVAAGPSVKTERMYRSASFEGETTAANPLEPAGIATAGVLPDSEPPVAAYAAPAMDESVAFSPESPAMPAPASERGLKTLSVALLITVVTSAVGLVDVFLNRQFTYLTGAAFVVVCIIAALKVRPSDLWTAVITPPLAFLVSLLIAGQVTAISGAGDILLREATMVATGLAFNAPYIFGGTLAALVIVLIRRSRLRSGQAR